MTFFAFFLGIFYFALKKAAFSSKNRFLLSTFCVLECALAEFFLRLRLINHHFIGNEGNKFAVGWLFVPNVGAHAE